jgi:hypothetical protein
VYTVSNKSNLGACELPCHWTICTGVGTESCAAVANAGVHMWFPHKPSHESRVDSRSNKLNLLQSSSESTSAAASSDVSACPAQRDAPHVLACCGRSRRARAWASRPPSSSNRRSTRNKQHPRRLPSRPTTRRHASASGSESGRSGADAAESARCLLAADCCDAFVFSLEAELEEEEELQAELALGIQVRARSRSCVRHLLLPTTRPAALICAASRHRRRAFAWRAHLALSSCEQVSAVLFCWVHC